MTDERYNLNSEAVEGSATDNTTEHAISEEQNNSDFVSNPVTEAEATPVTSEETHEESVAPKNEPSSDSYKSDNPVFNTAPPEKSSINMQYKPRKTPTWLIVLLCTITVLHLILSVTLIVLLNPFNSGKTNPASLNNQNTNDDIIIEEHLPISESPKSLGAKTSDDALTVKQISEKVRPSVVGVICQNPSTFAADSVGSGIIMSSDGYIITNNHVIEGMSRIQVVLDDGTTYEAILIGADSRSDLAVIKINATNLPAAEFGDSEQLEQGDPAIAIGNPAGLQLQNTVTYGIISAINRDVVVEDRTMTLIQTDASINPGNSGGPLVNEFGQVIGINTIKVGISYYEGLGFAIPMNTAKPLIDELISRGYIKGRPSIGITGQTLSDRDSAYYGLPSGLYIEYVHPQSDAYKKGIRRGDIITHMNGTKFSSTAEIKKIRDNFSAGDTVTLTIYRESKEIDVDVILMDEAELSSTSSYNG